VVHAPQSLAAAMSLQGADVPLQACPSVQAPPGKSPGNIDFDLKEQSQSREVVCEDPMSVQDASPLCANTASPEHSRRGWTVASLSPGHLPRQPWSPGPSIRRRASQIGDSAAGLVAPMRTGSMRACILALTFSAVGAGILGLPWAVASLGWALGLGMLVVNAILSAVALWMLVEVREMCTARSYAQAVEFYFGPALGQCLAAILALGSFGSACASMMFATNFLVDILSTEAIANIIGHSTSVSLDSSQLTKPLCIMVLVAILFLLSLSRDVTRWKYASVACVVVLLYVAAALIGKAAGNMSHEDSGNDFADSLQRSSTGCKPLPSDSFVAAVNPGLEKMSQAIAVLIFSFCCHFNLFSVVDTLANPTQARARTVIAWTVVLQSALYLFVGLAGYIVWKQALLRSSNTGNVLACWGPNDIVIAIARGLMIITLLVSSTMNMHPTRENILRFIFKCCSKDCRRRCLVRRGPDGTEDALLMDRVSVFAMADASWPAYLAVTLVIIALISIIVVVVPSVLDVLGFIGGLCGVSLMFAFPAALYVRVCVFNDDVTKRKSLLAISPVLLLFGVISFFGLVAVGVSIKACASR